MFENLRDFEGTIEGKLTVKFVYDWRLKTCECMVDRFTVERKQWARQSRLAAREFNISRRLDTFLPATGCHTTNLAPPTYLQQVGQLQDESGGLNPYSVTLAALDVKDALLQVPQNHIFKIRLNLQCSETSQNNDPDRNSCIGSSGSLLLRPWDSNGVSNNLAFLAAMDMLSWHMLMIYCFAATLIPGSRHSCQECKQSAV